MDNQGAQSTPLTKRKGIHYILAQSYSFFFLFFLFGLILDLFFPIKNFFQIALAPHLGLLFLIFASYLIFWAQKSSKDFAKIKRQGNITKESFCHGPYRYTRNPTHWGIFLLIIGFGLVANAFFVIFFTVVSFVVTKLIFLTKEEIILSNRYGEAYQEYKKTVRF